MIDGGQAVNQRPGVIEILNRSGQVLQRIPWDGSHQRIGRAYDNDIIVGDPYVCPHHLEIWQEDGKIRLRDTGSVNGAYLGRQRRRFGETRLSDETLVHFGHSQLRFRRAHTPVEDTWRDISRHGLLAQFDKTWVLLLLSALAFAALVADSILDSMEMLGPGQLITDQLYPLLGVLTWAGSWALVNRVIAHRANFHVHLAIACAGIVGLFLATQLVALAGFSLAADALVPWVKLAARIAVLACVVYAHLRYATHGRPTLQWVMAAFSGALLFGIPAFGDYLEQQEFSTIPYLNPLLKPPEFRLADGVDPDTFFEQAAGIRDSLTERETEEQAPSDP
jgi:pSer/pThr/pTyr-binding forkhead associated (FHA) protein